MNRNEDERKTPGREPEEGQVKLRDLGHHLAQHVYVNVVMSLGFMGVMVDLGRVAHMELGEGL
jgi:hypothetical protein